jgi:hypothetical protein
VKGGKTVVNYVLTAHAAQCLGINPSALNLPRAGDGIDADALWRSPRYAEIVTELAAIRKQFAERRYTIESAVEHRGPLTERDLRLARQRERQHRRVAARKAAAASRAKVV